MANVRYCVAAYDDGSSLVFSASADGAGELPFPVDVQASLDEAWAEEHPTPPPTTPTPTTPNPTPTPTATATLNPNLPPFAVDKYLIVYASANGVDANSGLSPDKPVRTIGAALKILNASVGKRQPVLALARGSTWTPSTFLSDFPNGCLVVAWGIGTQLQYARPVIKPNHGGSAVSLTDKKGVTFFEVCLQAHPDWYGVGDGGLLVSGGSDIKLVGCEIKWFRVNVVTRANKTNRLKGLTFERCVLMESFSKGGKSGHSQGIFAEETDGLVFSDCSFVRNGYAPQGLTNIDPAPATMMNHGAYIHGSCGPVEAVGNLFLENSSHGLQARSGGKVEGNLFINNAVAMSMGLVEGDGPIVVGGVVGEITRNLVIGGRDIGSQQRGIGIQVGNAKAVSITGNLFLEQLRRGSYAAISLEVGSGKNAEASVGIVKLLIRGNRCVRWTPGVMVEEGMSKSAKTKKWMLGDVQITTDGLGSLVNCGDAKVNTTTPVYPEGIYQPLVAYVVERKVMRSAPPANDVVVGGMVAFRPSFGADVLYPKNVVDWVLAKYSVA